MSRGIDRRTFLKTAGAGAAALTTGLAPRVAGPFEADDLAGHGVPGDKKLSDAWVRALFARGEATWYQGSDLDRIGMPIGGIGTGQLYLSGDGRLLDWQIFNRIVDTGYGETSYEPDRFPAQPVEQGFALQLRSGSGLAEVRSLDRRGFSDVRFRGEYPIGIVEYGDEACPVAVRLEAFSPHVPLQTDDSSLPATLLHYTLRNTGREPVAVTLAGWLQNAIGLHSGLVPEARRSNQLIQRPWGRILELRARPAIGTPDFGTLALAVLAAEQTVGSAALPDGALPEALFAPGETGALRAEPDAVRGMQALLRGAVGVRHRLAPGESFDVRFVVSWHFPYRLVVGNHYAPRFEGAAGVVEYAARGLERLVGDTRLWHRTWYDSTLPHWLLDRIYSTVSTLATNTCQRRRNGRFWAWEGVGCCGGTCGHVWNYEQAMARLFPELERSVREMQDFDPDAGFDPETGAIAFRGDRRKLRWAADAQAGYVLKAYREHLVSCDADFLGRVWPRVRQALEFLMLQDENDDGIIEGKQHTTYDIDFYGANTMVGSLYLAALRAGEEMARITGANDFAGRCRRLFAAGSRHGVERLFDGEYFVQDVDPEEHPKHQYGAGCLSDQLFGQSWAHQVGLGPLYPAAETRSALRAIWRYNWTPDVGPQSERHPPERWFARPGEAGLFVCTWPKSPHPGRTSLNFRDEVWTGIEYQVAAHMAWEGMVTQALAIVRGIHERYHPSKHNPWNEVECGDHYARGMASYGVFLGLCGFEYDGPAGRIGFAPRFAPERFRAAFTGCSGWGSIDQARDDAGQHNRIEVHWGELEVREVSCESPVGVAVAQVEVRAGERTLPSSYHQRGPKLVVKLEQPQRLRRGERLEWTSTWRQASA